MALQKLADFKASGGELRLCYSIQHDLQLLPGNCSCKKPGCEARYRFTLLCPSYKIEVGEACRHMAPFKG